MRIHVFGPGVGESIVLQYPRVSTKGYYWGVIDCHSERVVRFLQDEQNVQELEFVCWTHPHADHHNGMPPLLQAYKDRIHRFWRFGGYNAPMLMTFYDRFTKNTTAKNEQRTTYLKIKEIFDFALEQKERKEHGVDSYKILADIHSGLIGIKYNNKCSFKISSLGPSSRLTEEYTSHLDKWMYQLDLDGGGFSLDWKAFDRECNNISAALFIEFGRTRLLFGADAEKELWGDIADSEERKNLSLSLSSHFVKVSHHGSEGAYHRDSWREIAQKGSPSAVVTPFNCCRLPSNKGLTLLKQHCKEICLTATGKNYKYRNTVSTSTKLKYKWKDNVLGTEHCTFEFDHLGNLTETSLSDTAVVF